MKLDSITLYDADRSILPNPGGVAIYDAVDGEVVRSGNLGEPEKLSLRLVPFSGAATATSVDGLPTIRRRRILRLAYSDGSFREYRITRFERDLTGGTPAIIEAEFLPHVDLVTRTPRRTLTGGRVDVRVRLAGLSPQDALGAVLGASYGPPATVKAGTVTGAGVTEVFVTSDGRLSFGDIVRQIAEQAGLEVEFEYDSGDQKYAVNLVTEAGWTAAERTAGTASPERRPIGIGTGTDGNRLELTRQSMDRGYVSHIIPLGGGDEELQTIADARFLCTGAVYSSPSTTLTLSGDPIYVSECLVGRYAGNAATGWFLITSTTAPGTVVVTGDASGLDSENVYFALNGSGDDLVTLDHPDAIDGTVEEPVQFSAVVPFRNHVQNANFSAWTAGNPDDWTSIGSPTVTEDTDSRYVANGTKSAKVVAAEDEGLQQAVTIVADAENPYHSIWLNLRVTSGKVVMTFVDADGVEHPEEEEASSNQDQLIGIHMQGMQFAAGSGTIRITAYGGAATFYLDAITLTYSAGAYQYATLMGPEELWREGGRYLAAKKYEDAFQTEFFDVKVLGKADTDEVALGSWVTVKDGFNGVDHDIDFTARVVGIQIFEDPRIGALRKAVAVARRVEVFTDRFGNLKKPFTGPAGPEGGPGTPTRPHLVAQQLYIDAEGVLHVVWNGSTRASGVYVKVTSGLSPSDPADPTASAYGYTSASEDGDLSLGTLVASHTAIVKIRPYTASGPIGDVVRLSIKGLPRSVNWRGAWSNATTDYKVNDSVTHEGTGYICILAHDATAISTDEPGLGSAWGTYWEVYSQGFTDKGAWLTSTAYAVGNIVSNGGAVYHCIQQHTSGSSTEPGTGASWETYWTLWAAKGDPGDQGDPGDPGASVNWRGPWVTSTAYAVLDMVSHGGKSWTCIVGHTSGASTEPGVGASYATYWDLAADKGADGSDGADGTDGATGPEGPKGFDYKGAWATSTAYVADDGVRGSDGRVYICILGHTSGASSEPITGGSYSTYWTLFVERGPGRVATMDVVFTPKAADIDGTLEYTTGTVTMDDGTSYTINYGTRELALTSTGTYYFVYFDPDIATDRFYITSNRATAVASGTGGNRVLIGAARKGATAADSLEWYPQWGKPSLTEQSINVASLTALLARIGVLDIEDVLTILSGGAIEIPGSGDQKLVIDSDGMRVVLDGNPLGTVAKFRWTNTSGNLWAQFYFDDDTQELILDASDPSTSAKWAIRIGKPGQADIEVNQFTGDISITPGSSGELDLDYLTLPTSDGDDEDVLATDGAGVGSWVKRHRTLYAQHDEKANASSTETTLLSITAGDTVGSKTLPANYLIQGRHLRLRMSGYYLNDGTNSHILRIYLGSVLLASKTLTLPNTGGTERNWYADLNISVEALSGTTATIYVAGPLHIEQTDGTMVTYVLGSGVSTKSITGANSTKDLGVSSDWGSATVFETFNMTQLTLEELY